MRNRLVVASISVLLSALLPRPVAAECISPGPWLIKKGLVELVFSGNVVGVNEINRDTFRVTFDVDRVWAGSVPKRFDLYLWYTDTERPELLMAQRYVVFCDKVDSEVPRGNRSTG